MAEAGAMRAPRSWFWLQGLICGGVIATAPGTALITSVLLAPATVAYAIDATPGKPYFRVMALLGASCTFVPLRLLWDHGGSVNAALDLLGDPLRPLLSWSFCGAGWVLTELAQLAARLSMTAKETRLIKALQTERAVVVEEWLDAKPPPS